MSIANPIWGYVSSVSPDVNQTLSIVPQRVLTEVAEVEQQIIIADDGIDHTLAFSTDSSFTFTLQWDTLSDEDAATILDFWLSTSLGYRRSFKWSHPFETHPVVPASDHVYVVKFETDIGRLFNPGTIRGITQIKLKVKGYTTP
jgi:hypothetical protein